MAFIRYKNIHCGNGIYRTYAYLVENYWDPNKQKPRQKVVKYLGKKNHVSFNYHKIMARDKHTCQACGTQENLTIDHIKPLALGGTNLPENLQVLCLLCNQKKGVQYDEA